MFTNNFRQKTRTYNIEWICEPERPPSQNVRCLQGGAGIRLHPPNKKGLRLYFYESYPLDMTTVVATFKLNLKTKDMRISRYKQFARQFHHSADGFSPTVAESRALTRGQENWKRSCSDYFFK